MDLLQEIILGFSLSSELVLLDSYINENPDLLCIDQEIDHMICVPSYMIWVLKNRDTDGNLTCDYTLNALAEYGRSKNRKSNHLNFKYRCNSVQKALVLEFLVWCETSLLLADGDQLQRAIKYWSKS